MRFESSLSVLDNLIQKNEAIRQMARVENSENEEAKDSEESK